MHTKSSKKRGTDINTKIIVLDDISANFLKNLRTIRKNLGLTIDFVAKAAGVVTSSVIALEQGVCAPKLALLIKLAEILNTDISESINYKFFYGKIKPEQIKKAIRTYGLSYKELSQITGYERKHISLSVRLKPKASLSCLEAVLQVIHKEKTVAEFRDALTREKRNVGRPAKFST